MWAMALCPSSRYKGSFTVRHRNVDPFNPFYDFRDKSFGISRTLSREKHTPAIYR